MPSIIAASYIEILNNILRKILIASAFNIQMYLLFDFFVITKTCFTERFLILVVI